MATNPNLARIVRLTKYIENCKNDKINIPSKHKGNENVYLEWLDREIRKSENVISKLRG